MCSVGDSRFGAVLGAAALIVVAGAALEAPAFEVGAFEVRGASWVEPDGTAEVAAAPAWDLSTTAGGRAFALELLNGRDEEDEATALLVAELRASLPAYRAAGRASDVALIEAVLASDEGDLERAIEFAERSVELAPRDAEAHYVLGTALINDVSRGSFGLSTLGKVNKAKAAWKTAEELDPEHVGARISLAMYYLQAPGIAGGDKKKAEAYGESLIASGETSWGRRIMMMASIGRKRWDEARGRLDSMVADAETDRAKREAYLAYLVPVLLEHERVEDALEVLPELARISEAKDANVSYLYGRAYEERGDRGDEDRAIDSYLAALAARPEAKNSRWRVAELLREADRDAEAAVHYAEFAERFPDDDDAKKASKYAERLTR